MDVIYYYCYLFYVNYIRDVDPHSYTVYAISAVEGYALNIFVDIILTFFKCMHINTLIWMSILILICFFNYLHFDKSGRGKKIVKKKPMFFSNHKLSIVLSALFFIILFSTFLLGAFYSKYLSDTYCR